MLGETEVVPHASILAPIAALASDPVRSCRMPTDYVGGINRSSTTGSAPPQQDDAEEHDDADHGKGQSLIFANNFATVEISSASLSNMLDTVSPPSVRRDLPPRYHQIVKYYSVATLRLALRALLGERQVRVPDVDGYEPRAVGLLTKDKEQLTDIFNWLSETRYCVRLS